ncbi:MAG TPA: 2Fe-2S iron-sulfur cluster-binding protein [Geminicoccaceae bacterium]|nr:2Fe-2S iron-sulfur cluster-binding protein [Geminicoccaceae bacterium]
MPRITFVAPDGTSHPVEAPAGLSLLQVARLHDLDIEGACGGSLACATCHVIVAPEYSDLLAPPSEEEEGMLDLAPGVTPTSRLGCQIVLSEQLDGLEVRIA